ncbi:ABC transporter substrate-binding protein [Rhodococcus oxybenzonivorans]|uniref:ABC transporter substrate-binding protein n=1 Tax=Rhodococcus oxybenzonivorans TaxID=1990687 RepID=UPI00295447A7|nr:ABC transporter substrate-binding protein [Rhodococcus oxybenzonivorans]MDV7352763.1 ABC transporter substrate-binding protein [Rhodococcus oxybenzonivorans]
MMDPHLTPSIVGAYPYLSPIYDRLVRVVKTDNGTEFAPMAAESWELAPDGKALTFHLREAAFHSGQPVDADAVKWSLERAKTLPASTVKRVLASIDTIEAPDARTVVLRLNRPASDILYHLSTLAGAIVDPVAGDRDLSREAFGSGPYRMNELRVGDRASYVRFDGYWDPNAQNMASVEIVGLADDQARLNALRSGQVEVALTKVTQYPDASRLAESGQFGLTDTDQSAWYAMYFNVDDPALADVRVRRAMNLAIDREALSAGLFNDQCTPTSQPLQAGVLGYDEESADRYTYDPDQAKRLLAEAGFGDGKPVELDVLTVAGARTSEGLAVAIQEQMRQVGVELRLQPRDLSQAVVEWREGRAAGFQYTHPGAADPAVTLQDSYLDWLYPGTAPEDVAAVLRAPLDSTLTPDDRTAALTASSRVASENALELYVCSIPTQYLHTNQVSGLDRMSPPTTGGPFDLREVEVSR